jgi:CRISPR-associated protein (TIGR02710 family)
MILILTVGTGTPGKYSNLAQGLINTLEIEKPSAFWLIPSASPDSIAVAELIVDGVAHDIRSGFQHASASQKFITISNHDSLDEARCRIAEVIQLARNNFPDTPIFINPTSGTKQMSAGATLAALDEAVNGISFTTGKRYDGIVMTGTEVVTPFDAARWRAEKEALLAGKLWNLNFHHAAAAAFRTASSHLVQNDKLKQRLLALAILADAYASKANFHFGEATKQFKEAATALVAEPEDTPLQQLQAQAQTQRKICDKLKEAQGGKRDISLQKKLLEEIICNANRAATAQRYDDAACRLYRAMEMQLQIRLSELTNSTYWNGKLAKDKTPPEILNTSEFLSIIKRPELPSDFSMEMLARALHRLGDDKCNGLCEDLDMGYKSRFREATHSRNSSILAHGVKQVQKEEFNNLSQIAHQFLAISASDSQLAPPFDPAWIKLTTP